MMENLRFVLTYSAQPWGALLVFVSLGGWLGYHFWGRWGRELKSRLAEEQELRRRLEERKVASLPGDRTPDSRDLPAEEPEPEKVEPGSEPEMGDAASPEGSTPEEGGKSRRPFSKLAAVAVPGVIGPGDEEETGGAHETGGTNGFHRSRRREEEPAESESGDTGEFGKLEWSQFRWDGWASGNGDGAAGLVAAKLTREDEVAADEETHPVLVAASDEEPEESDEEISDEDDTEAGDAEEKVEADEETHPVLVAASDEEPEESDEEISDEDDTETGDVEEEVEADEETHPVLVASSDEEPEESDEEISDEDDTEAGDAEEEVAADEETHPVLVASSDEEPEESDEEISDEDDTETGDAEEEVAADEETHPVLVAASDEEPEESDEEVSDDGQDENEAEVEESPPSASTSLLEKSAGSALTAGAIAASLQQTRDDVDPSAKTEPVPLPSESGDSDTRVFLIPYETTGTMAESGAQILHDAVSEIGAAGEEGAVLIRGYSDSEGSEEFNRLLSQAWARDVADHLVDEGIDSSRLEVEGLGGAESDRGKPENLRCWVEIHLG